MRGQATVNILDDKEMSSQGSVNALVVAPSPDAQVQAPARQQYDTPFGLFTLAKYTNGLSHSNASSHRTIQ